MTEAQITSKFLKQIRQAFPAAFVYKINERIRAGIPDALIVLRGHVVFVEFKGPKTPVTELQRLTHDRLTAAGATVLLVRFTGAGTAHELTVVSEHNAFAYESLLAYLEAL